MNITRHNHILTFKLGNKELDKPCRVWIRFVESLKKAIPSHSRDFDRTAKRWYIDEDYEKVLNKLIIKYFGG